MVLPSASLYLYAEQGSFNLGDQVIVGAIEERNGHARA